MEENKLLNLLQNILIWGDSHVRRMTEFSHILTSRLENTIVTVRGVGGATITSLTARLDQIPTYDAVILMVGGNDLSNGVSLHSIMQSYENLGRRLLSRGIRRVVITSVWPRSNRRFNLDARRLAHWMYERYYGDHQLTYWIWDRRQTLRTVDGVHLHKNGYRRAMGYLMSIAVWVLNRLNLQRNQ